MKIDENTVEKENADETPIAAELNEITIDEIETEIKVDTIEAAENSEKTTDLKEDNEENEEQTHKPGNTVSMCEKQI